MYALSLILHYQTPNPMDVDIDAAFADQMFMDDEEGVSSLRQVEMQEAFRRGISKEYGDFFGITPASLLQFLKGYRECEKRKKAIAILYAKQKEETISQEKRLEYELKARGFVNPWGKKEKKKITPEESEAHRKKIAQQREQILKQLEKDAGQE